MNSHLKRGASTAVATALVASGIVLTSIPTAGAAAGQVCTDPSSTVSLFGFNDFHGRIDAAAKLFTVVEDERNAKGADNVVLLSQGDNIGGSTFVSGILDDEPTLDILSAIGVDAVAAGNHEFDKGWSDLSGRVIPKDPTIPYLGANVYSAGSTDVVPGLKEYTVIEAGGLNIAVIGAVTSQLPSLVSPAGISMLSIGDPVEAINRVAAELAADPSIDVIIASIHEGAPNGAATIGDNIAASEAFADIAQDTSADVDLILNGHTHQTYAWTTSKGAPILQAAEYGTKLSRVSLGVSSGGDYCGIVGTPTVVGPATAAGTSEAIEQIESIVADASAVANELGNREVGVATKAISTPGDGGSGTRNVESPMSNLVAQMFYDTLSNGDTSFIGLQNPGGTRTSFDKGAITYKEAADVLPFANTLMTTEITGAQFKRVLEQQWQRNPDGSAISPAPSRLFLALGISKNVTYTLDESRAWGDRITSITINGKPINPKATYRVGSGSFLISGGDNFWEMGNGKNAADTGKVDLETWVNWISGAGALRPDYTKRGVSVTGSTTLTEGKASTLTLGEPLTGGQQIDTLDMLLNPTGDRVSPQLANVSVTAKIGRMTVGKGKVVGGVAAVSVKIPKHTVRKSATMTLTLTVSPSGTKVSLPVKVNPAKPTKPHRPKPGKPKPGNHNHSGHNHSGHGNTRR